MTTGDRHKSPNPLFAALSEMKKMESVPNSMTQRAFDELESIQNLDQLREICAEQKRKRGW